MTLARSSTYLNELEMLQSGELLVTRYNKSDGIFKASCKMFMFFMWLSSRDKNMYDNKLVLFIIVTTLDKKGQLSR